MADLHLPVKREYFDQIKSGQKQWEYRLRTPYWKKRVENRTYNNIVITLGYPPREDTERRITFPWRGYVEKTRQHKHFGDNPVDVFAIGLWR